MDKTKLPNGRAAFATLGATRTCSSPVARAYSAMADLTRKVCRKTCMDSRPNRCCEPMYCDSAINYAKSEGVTLTVTSHPTLPLMGADGRCTAPAHLRPICAAHQCDILSLGFFKPRSGLFSVAVAAKLTDRYFALRERASADCDIDSQYEGETA